MKTKENGGLTDLFGSTSNLDDYSNLDDQIAYLEGRLLGDAFAMAQGATQVSSGGSAAAGGFATGPGALVISTTGGAVALHGMGVGAVATADAAWAAAKLLQIKAKSKTSNNTPPNKGVTNKPHGGNNHNNAIDNRINQLRNDKYVKNIRKNQRQVDGNGKRVGNLRNTPDIQFDKYNPKTKQWEHHVIEYDNVQKNSTIHGLRIKHNDPNAKIELNVL